jgi:5'-3' exonuclease
MSKRILLIDLSAIFHPAWRSNENGPVSVAYEATIGGVNRCISVVKPDATAICLDGKGNWRKELDKSYKAQRDPLPPVFYAEFDRVKQRLRDDGLLLWQADGFEADDLIATAAELALTGTDPAGEVVIATHDKDMFQLVGQACKVLSLSTFEIRDAAAVQGKFGVAPSQLGDWLALVGDSSDNVKGAPGIGPKTATKLLQAYGNLAGVFRAAYDLKSDLTPAIRKSLTENGDGIELARKLVTLRTDAPIKFEEIWETREVKPLITTEEEMPHDLGAVQEEIEDKAAEAWAKDPQGDGPQPPRDKTPEEIAMVSQTGPAQSTELVTVEYSKQLEPRSFRDVLTFAKYAFNSRLYQKFTSPDAIAMVIVRGRELGYGASSAMEVFHVIEGRPYPFAYLVVAECQKDPNCEYLIPVEFDGKHAVAETKHRASGKVITLEYTFEQAVTAKIVRDNNGWAKHPEDMLVKTALCKLGRRMYPARALGLVSLEEIGEA